MFLRRKYFDSIFYVLFLFGWSCLSVVYCWLRLIPCFLIMTLFSLRIVFLIRTLHYCLCPFCRVLFSRDFLELALVIVSDSGLESFPISWFFCLWFSISLESVGAFPLLCVFSMPISSMRLFKSSTLVLFVMCLG